MTILAAYVVTAAVITFFALDADPRRLGVNSLPHDSAYDSEGR